MTVQTQQVAVKQPNAGQPHVLLACAVAVEGALKWAGAHISRVNCKRPNAFDQHPLCSLFAG